MEHHIQCCQFHLLKVSGCLGDEHVDVGQLREAVCKNQTKFKISGKH